MISDEILIGLINNPETPGYVLHDRFEELQIKAMKIFHVSGEHGVYSDKEIWPIASFLSKEDAEKFIEAIKEEKKKINYFYGQKYYDGGFNMDDIKSKLDTLAEPFTFLGNSIRPTNYHITEINLHAKAEEALKAV